MVKLESIALIFDSGKYGPMYGSEIFKEIFSINELKQNSKEMLVSLGELMINSRHIDIGPYTINDDLLTIDRNCRFSNMPYCYIIEDNDNHIVALIDIRLKQNSKGYLGLTRISNKYNDKSKQFWKLFKRDFIIEGSEIKVFVIDEYAIEEFRYKELAEKYGFIVTNYKSEFIKFNLVTSGNDYKLRDDTISLERNIVELSISLSQELEIAGSLIWEGMTKLNNIKFVYEDIFNTSEYLPELSFMCLYDSAQGIERLQKIIILLYCRLNGVLENDEEKLSKLLYSHNHQGLNDF